MKRYPISRTLSFGGSRTRLSMKWRSDNQRCQKRDEKKAVPGPLQQWIVPWSMWHARKVNEHLIKRQSQILEVPPNDKIQIPKDQNPCYSLAKVHTNIPNLKLRRLMNSTTKRSALIALVLAFTFAVGCSMLSDETDKANKLVTEGNTAIDEGNKLATDGSAKNDKLFDEISADNFEADKEKLTPTAKEAVDMMTKAAGKYRDASKKFDEASKLKIGDKFKEYLTLKSQEFAKRAEHMETATKNSQAVLDSADAVALMAKVTANKPQLEKLDKESKDLKEKADKIQAENKDSIK